MHLGSGVFPYFCRKIMFTMKQFYLTMAVVLLICGQEAQGSNHVLKYDRPALHWNSALPIGNGRIGAMVFGHPLHEVFQLNEETISKGSPYNNYNPAARNSLESIRNLIFTEQNDSAQMLAEQTMISERRLGRGAPYQPAGCLHVDFTGRDSSRISNYRRTLDIGDAISRVAYTINNVEYRQEAFASFTDQLIVIRYTASKRKRISFSAFLSYPDGNCTMTAENGVLRLTGITGEAAPEVPGGVRFVVQAKIENKGGRLYQKDGHLIVDRADEVIIRVAMATNFNSYKDISADPDRRIMDYMTKADKPYQQVKAEHMQYYHRQFNRVSLDLGADRYPEKTTDERIRDFATAGDDGWLAALYFQYGRYLLISCSQPGTQPGNLQGLWNHKMNPAWSCRYTININTEMNYWPAEPTNLAEMHEPLVKMVTELAETGRQSAREMYGCRGWVAHHNTDLWRMTGAVDYAWSGVWPTSNAWFCQHLWNRFAYNGDMEYLRRVYPLMKGAAEFFVDFLVTDPRTGHKVVCPSISPENHPAGKKASLYAGVTMDNELVADLFTHTIMAARMLNTDRHFIDTIAELRNQLTPLRIGRHGQLQEWEEDWDNPNDHHRHVSHLWALYPGNAISPMRTPEAFEAAKTSLTQRGDPSTGWSMGWKVCLWARCLDGDHAYRLIQNQLNLIPDTIERGANGGTYPNMFDAHPPFQIDGNFGCTAGIAEMFVQSHDGFVNLLPALPKAWPKGRVKGLRTVGGFVVEDMTWEEGRLKQVTVRSTLGGNLRIGAKEKAVAYKAVSAGLQNPNPLFAVWSMPVEKDGQLLTAKCNNNLHLYDIETHKGETYHISFY